MDFSKPISKDIYGVASEHFSAESQTLSNEVQKIIEAGEPFTDPDFPPTLYSLLDKDPVNNDDEKKSEFMKTVVWKRASEIYGEKVTLFDGIGPEDVQQGYLGSCYFL